MSVLRKTDLVGHRKKKLIKNGKVRQMRKIKKGLSALLLFTLPAILLTGCSKNSNTVNTNTVNKGNPFGGPIPAVGEYVEFGRYEQDGDENNGPEPIEWEVLEIDMNRALLISKYVLDCKPYNEEFEEVTWESCSLRKWLNEDFYDTAFTEEEKACIPAVTLTNPDDPLADSDGAGGKETNDKVFILGTDDIRKYFPYSSWNEEEARGYSQALITDATPFATTGKETHTFTITRSMFKDTLEENGYTEDCQGLTGARMWVRTPGRTNKWAYVVSPEGVVAGGAYCFAVNQPQGVRPVIYVE